MVQGHRRLPLVLPTLCSLACGLVLACAEESVVEARTIQAELERTAYDARVVIPGGPHVVAAPDAWKYPRVSRLEIVVGQQVTKGDLLVTLEGHTETQFDIEIARSQLRRAELEVERAARPFAPENQAQIEPTGVGRVAAAKAERERLRTIAEEHRIAVRRAELRADRLRVRAPVSGRVIEVRARVGESVEPSRGILVILSNARAVRAQIERSALEAVKVGAPIAFESPVLDRVLAGRLAHIDEVGDPDAATVLVEGVFEGAHLLPHLGARGRLLLDVPAVASTGADASEDLR